jgi:site-specific DNA-methyltransferase (adenine-specific)
VTHLNGETPEQNAARPYYEAEGVTLHHGDCVEVMAALPEASVDAVACDPPYELGFMGKSWDAAGVAFRVETWAEALRVLKAGGHLVAFGGTRTHHRLMVAIEDAGFEVRDTLCWLYGSGFPKSLNIGDGWGTALKPAWEPIVLARKPLAGTVAANVQQFGTGALNIDAGRIGMDDVTINTFDDGAKPFGGGAGHPYTSRQSVGRWPANVALDPEAAALLDAQVGESTSTGGQSSLGAFRDGDVYGAGRNERWKADPGFGDTGGPSRFFYVAKASRAEREFGLWDLPPQQRADSDARNDDAPGSNNPRLRTAARRNDHPTVKPLALMRWLVGLVLPPGGTVLDPFVGSGTTGMAVLDRDGVFIGIDQDAHYLEIARRRIARRHLLAEPEQEADTEHSGQSVMALEAD